MNNQNNIIFHIDANYFFARCEEIKNPKLKLVPFAVCNYQNRSVVSTSNYLARNLNVKSGSKLKNFIDNKKIKVVEPNHFLYRTKSSQLFSCIEDFLNTNIEISSIDECYVDVSNIIENYHNNYLLLATELKKYIFKKTQLFVSIGIGENKFLAKMANEFKTKNNINVLFKNDVKTKLWPLDINKIYSIGKKTTILLNNLKIFKVKEFIDYENQNKLKKALGIKYYQIYNFCNGEDYSIVDTEDHLPKSISSGETFNINTSNETYLILKIKYLFNDIYHQLIRKKLIVSTLNINIKFNYTNHKSKSITLDSYTDNKDLLLSTFTKLFYNLWDSQEIRSLTLGFSNLKENKYKQQKIILN